MEKVYLCHDKYPSTTCNNLLRVEYKYCSAFNMEKERDVKKMRNAVLYRCIYSKKEFIKYSREKYFWHFLILRILIKHWLLILLMPSFPNKLKKLIILRILFTAMPPIITFRLILIYLNVFSNMETYTNLLYYESSIICKLNFLSKSFLWSSDICVRINLLVE